MKKLFTSVLLLIVCAIGSVAQELVAYQSKMTGINIQMPANMQVIQDTQDALQLQADGIVFTSTPIPTDALTQTKLEELMASVAKEMELSLSTMEMTSFETTTLKCVMFTGAVDGSTLYSVGYAEIKNNPAVGFIFTIGNTLAANSTATKVIKTYEFDPSSIQ